jgi:hypothetical protein
MKVQTIFVSIAMFFCLTAASFGQQVKTDYDHNATFGQYKTYTWEKIQTQDPLLVDRIKDAVNGAFSSQRLDPGGFGRRCLDRSDGDHAESTDSQHSLRRLWWRLALGRIRRRNDDH